MACPITKTLQVAFTAPNPAPSSGYRIKWRVVGTSVYTTEAGPFLNSPAVINNVPACDNVEGTIEAACGGTFSSVVSFLATKDQTFVCGNTISGSILSPTYYTYPKKLIDLQGSGDTITFNYDVSGVPNRINVYNSDNSLITSTGWKGEAAYPGPWGQSLSTATTGSLVFTKSISGGDLRWYYVTTEHAGSNSITDSWSSTINCTSGGGTDSYNISDTTIMATSSSGTVSNTETITITVTGTAKNFAITCDVQTGSGNAYATISSGGVTRTTGTVTGATGPTSTSPLLQLQPGTHTVTTFISVTSTGNTTIATGTTAYQAI